MSRLWERIQVELAHWRRKHWSFEQIAAHYDSLDEDYDDINKDVDSHFRRFTDGLRFSNVPDRARVLDAFSRTGLGIHYFWESGKVQSAACVDVSENLGTICQNRLHEAGFTDFTWHLIRDYSLPFADGEFDVVLSFETVEHVSEPDQLIDEYGRVTRPGGWLILTTPNVLWEPLHALAAILELHHSEGPHRFVPLPQLKRMCSQAGFAVERAETTVLIPAGPGWLVGLGAWIEKRTRRTLMPLLGLRRILICRKL